MADSELENQDKIRVYWDDYYSVPDTVVTPSLFATYVLSSLTNKDNIRLVDFGCGNGRDSFFFSKYFEVLGLDISNVAITENRANSKKIGASVKFDVCSSKADLTRFLKEFKPNLFYARFLLHAINLQSENELLSTLAENLTLGATIHFECRTVFDPLFQKGLRVSDNEAVYGHYRRFIVPEDLKNKLEKLGFKITFFATSNDFSPTIGDTPNLLRISAIKMQKI